MHGRPERNCTFITESPLNRIRLANRTVITSWRVSYTFWNWRCSVMQSLLKKKHVTVVRNTEHSPPGWLQVLYKTLFRCRAYLIYLYTCERAHTDTHIHTHSMCVCVCVVSVWERLRGLKNCAKSYLPN